jgi:hypothetical protein
VADVPLGKRFGAFASDLADDLLRHSKAIDEVRSHAKDVKEMARVHDALASKWSHYATAARFVQNIAAGFEQQGEAS